MTKRKVADLFSLQPYCTTHAPKVNEKTVNKPLKISPVFSHIDSLRPAAPKSDRPRQGRQPCKEVGLTAWARGGPRRRSTAAGR